jgi:small GTP-binding protein
MTTEVRVGVIGSVDAGKSTLTSVLTRGKLDNGKGSAREAIMKYPHERDSGRTSSITQHYMKNEDNSITFIDLAGHEKYLKTTMTGMNRVLDYCCLIIGSNMGVLRMTREHLLTALSLNLPTFVVLTKVDIAPENKYNETKKDLIKFINKKTSGRRTTADIICEEDLEAYLTSDSTNVIPIFSVSSKTGSGINVLHRFITTLEQRYNYNINGAADFIVEQRYNLKGIGLVVSGITKSGCIKVGDVLLMGSFYRKFYEVKVKSIHNNYREFVDKLEAGQGGCLALKLSEKFYHKKFKSGVHVIAKPQLYSKFKAKIKILQHPTTIKIGYEPTIHCESISQTAKIVGIEGAEYLRLGDTAEVEMEFKYHPEFLTVESRIIFREGATKGIGIITEVIE